MVTQKYNKIRRSGYVVVSESLNKCVKRCNESGKFNGEHWIIGEYTTLSDSYPNLFKDRKEAIMFRDNIGDIGFYYDSNTYNKNDFTVIEFTETMDVEINYEIIV